MKLRETYLRGRNPVTVGEAVRLTCLDYDHPDSMPEVRGRLDKMAGVIGRLVHELHDTGALSDDAVMRIVGNAYEKAE